MPTHYIFLEDVRTEVRLPRRIEKLIDKSFDIFLGEKEWDELREGLVKHYRRWGDYMGDYLCGNCKKPLINLWAYGPSCPRGVLFRGCGKMPADYAKRLLGGARKIRDIAIERAAEIVERTKKTAYNFSKKIDDVLL